MINHARTLLMNVDGIADFYPEIGEEIIPTTYRAKSLPQSLTNVRQVLFGQSPDRPMLNYRCRQLLSLLHRTELEEFVFALDPRTTYDFADDELYDDRLYQPTYQQLAGATNELYFQGSPTATDDSGKLHRQWLIEVTGSGTAAVTSFQPLSALAVTFTVTSGLSSPIDLPGSNLSIKLRNIVGLQYRVNSYARPVTDLGTLAATLKLVGAETLAGVFLTGTPPGAAEPFTSFRNLWELNSQLPYQLGGLLLGLIYHTEQL